MYVCIYIYIYIYMCVCVCVTCVVAPMVGRSDVFQEIRGAMALFVDVGDDHRWDVDHKLGVVKEVDLQCENQDHGIINRWGTHLNNAVAQAEHYGVLCSQPFLHVH